MEIEKIKKAWKKFLKKIADLEKRKFNILNNINKKLDRQQIESIRKKLKDYE